MTTMPVIPNFNVLEDGSAGGRAHRPIMAIEQLPAERRKKALGHRVVMTVGAPTHTDRNVVCRQQLTIIGGGILHATIAVMDQPWLRLPPSQGHSQCVDAKFRCQRFTHGPTNHHPATQIHQHGQIQPTLAGSHISYVTTPDAVRTTSFCLLYTSDAADERSSVDLG